MIYNLVGQDGNAFSLMEYTSRAMKEQKFTKDEIKAVMDEAMSRDYSHLVCTLDQAITKCNLRTNPGKWYEELKKSPSLILQGGRE